MRYEDALREARAQLGAHEDDRDVVLFRYFCPEECCFSSSLSDAMLGAVALSYDESAMVIVQRSRGVDGPWVEIRKVTVSIETTDPEVRS